MSHPIVHIEIPVSNAETGSGFYAELFGWQTHPMPEMNYTTFETGDGPRGGFPVADGQMAQAGEVLIYVLTDDVTASLDKAESLGATTLMPKTEIPGIGWFGIFRDPTGNKIAVFTNMPNGSMG